jgi:hypothetical protein
MDLSYPAYLSIKPASSDDLDSIYFDHQFYLSLYPCYKGHLKIVYDTYQHYIAHGIREKLIPNPALFRLIQTSQEFLLQYQLAILPEPPLHQAPSGGQNPLPFIYVLTRTCRREQLFRQCVDSLLSQHYLNLRHIVSYDHPETLRYVSQYQHLNKVVNLMPQKARHMHPNQYIDCLYDYVLASDPGWVMVLDDDDKFMTDRALTYLQQFLVDPTSIVIWQLYRSDKTIYPADKKNPVVGEIGSCCYLYHSSMIRKGFWRPGGIGDFPFFHQLFEKAQNHLYVDYPLTGVNYTDQVSGWTAM